MSAIAAEYCLDCGWEHANLAGCWRKALREARETLTRPDLDPEIRAELQAAAEALARTVADDVAFYEGLSVTAQEDY